MPSNWTRAMVLLVASTGAAAFANAVRPGGLSWVLNPETSANPNVNKKMHAEAALTFEQMMELLASGATFVDARKPEEHAEGHIAGSINIPSTEKENKLDVVYGMLPRDQIIVIYCGGGTCEASGEVFEFLVKSGFDPAKLRLFEPGWEFIVKRTDVPIAKGAMP